MAEKMKAAIVDEFKKPLRIDRVAIPEPGPGEALVKVKASGVCHTDLHAASGDWPIKPRLPLIPGHEAVGLVAKIGKGVVGLKEGDAVGVPWLHDACGCCEYCTTGWETLCEAQHNTGYSVNGGYAEYAIAAAPFVGRLPDKPDFVAMAPILCAGVTTYKGIKETEAKPGEWLVVSGVGGLGHVAVQYAKAMGLHVAAVDIADDKLELARRLGADLTANAATEDAVAKIVKETRGGAHGALVTAVSTSAFRQAIAMTRRHGTVSLVGLPPGDFGVPIFDVVVKRITIRGSIVGTRKDLSEAIAFAADGKVKTIVSERRLEDINDIFTEMKEGQIEGRIVLSQL